MLKSDTGRVGVQEKVWMALYPVQIFPKWILQKRTSFPIRFSLMKTDPWTAKWTNVVSKQEIQMHRGGFIWTLPNLLGFYQPVFSQGTSRTMGSSIPGNFSARWPPKIRVKNYYFNWKLTFPIQCRVQAWWEMTSYCENIQNIIASKMSGVFLQPIGLAICNVRIFLVCPLIIHIFQHPPKSLPLSE